MFLDIANENGGSETLTAEQMELVLDDPQLRVSALPSMPHFLMNSLTSWSFARFL